MASDALPRMLRMLSQIQALSHDPDAAALVQSGNQLAANLAPVLRMHQPVQATAALDEDENSPRLLSLLPMQLSLSRLLQNGGFEVPLQRGLGERALSRLPQIRMTSQKLERMKSSCEGEAMCAVCQEDYVVGQKLVQLPCDHFFCVDCAMQWLRQNKSCPVCRNVVQDDEDTAWHSRELFPFRLPQGSTLAAIRGAREATESAALELRPPTDDMSRIAEMQPVATSVTSQTEVSLPRLIHPTEIVADNEHVTALELTARADEVTSLGRTSPSSTGVAQDDTQGQSSATSERAEQRTIATPVLRSSGVTADRRSRLPRGSTTGDASHSSIVRGRAPASSSSLRPTISLRRPQGVAGAAVNEVRNNTAAALELRSPPRTRLRSSRY